jgi:hypothetical protein
MEAEYLFEDLPHESLDPRYSLGNLEGTYETLGRGARSTARGLRIGGGRSRRSWSGCGRATAAERSQRQFIVTNILLLPISEKR